MAIDDTRLPLVLSANVARTKPDGKPTKALIEWEFDTREWYKASAVDLDTRLTSVQSQTDENEASFTEDINALTSDLAAEVTQREALEAETAATFASVESVTDALAAQDLAFASDITTVTATADAASAAAAAAAADASDAASDAAAATTLANNATASGAIYLAAKATPTGATAAYGIYLTAGASFTGFEMIALSGGGSAIAMSADQFTFTDSGTATQVFDYSGGLFRFNVPVEVQTIDIKNQAVNVPYIGTALGSDTVISVGTVPNGLLGVWRDAVSVSVVGTAGYFATIQFFWKVTQDSSGGFTTTTTWRIAKYVSGVYHSTLSPLELVVFPSQGGWIDIDASQASITYKVQIRNDFAAGVFSAGSKEVTVYSGSQAIAEVRKR